MSLGSVTEMLHFFVAKYSKKQQLNEGGGVKDEEEIEVLELDFKDSLEMIKSGEIDKVRGNKRCKNDYALAVCTNK